MHLLPIQLQQNMVVESTIASMLPWQTPGLLALSGSASPDSGNSILAICYEWPTSWMRTVQDIDQFQLEWLHLQRFRTDHILATGSAPFFDVAKGGDPPDAVVTTEHGTLGVECTGLTIGARRGAHGLFRNIRQALASQPPALFGALGGHMVYMWFNESDSVLTRPYRRSDTEAANELVEALVRYHPQPEQLWVPGGTGPPEQAPDLKMYKTTAGASFYCAPIVACAPETVLFTVAGFEVGFAYTTMHEAEAEWNTLSKRVTDKDRPESDWLLISAGAPDQRGNMHPAEEALADFLLANPRELVSLTHLQRVTIHSWSTGRAVDIWPEVKPVFGPLYQGIMPSNQPLVIPAASVGPTTDQE
jgi:hypothetical protein